MVRWLLNLFRPHQNLEPALELLQMEVRVLRDENRRLRQMLREFSEL